MALIELLIQGIYIYGVVCYFTTWFTHLHLCSEHLPLCFFLLYLSLAGADLNNRDLDGDTPLHICESPEVAEYLLANGADEQAVNNEGKSVYEQAVDLENEAMVVFWAARLGLTVTYTEQQEQEGATMESVQEEQEEQEEQGGTMEQEVVGDEQQQQPQPQSTTENTDTI